MLKALYCFSMIFERCALAVNAAQLRVFSIAGLQVFASSSVMQLWPFHKIEGSCSIFVVGKVASEFFLDSKYGI